MMTTLESEFAVVLLTHDGTIVDAHPTCAESLGWTREELNGKDIGELLQSDRELLMTQLQQSRDAEVGADGHTSFSVRILARRRDETSFPARVVVRRFDQTDCCTAAFYRVNPQNDSDTPPIVRAEEIELAMRGNAERPNNKPVNQVKERPKSRWRNARLLFGGSKAAEPEPAPVEEVAKEITREAPKVTVKPPAKPAPPVPVFHSQVPEDIFLRRNVPPTPAVQEEETLPVTQAPEPMAMPEAETESILAAPEPLISETSETAAIEPVSLPESRPPLVVEEDTKFIEASSDETPTYESLAQELEQERTERRRLEQRASSLSSQVSSLHLQLSEHLEIESRNQTKVNSLEDQVRESKSQLAQLKAEIASERQKSQAADEKAEAATVLSARLTEQFDSFKLVHEALARTQSESETQLQAVKEELKQAQDALESETKKRQQLEVAATATLQERAEHDRKAKLDLCKLETALKAKELELKQAEVQRAQDAYQAKG